MKYNKHPHTNSNKNVRGNFKTIKNQLLTEVNK